MIGVPIKDPKTPPLEIVNVPPAISSKASDPFETINDSEGGVFHDKINPHRTTIFSEKKLYT